MVMIIIIFIEANKITIVREYLVDIYISSLNIKILKIKHNH